MLIIVFHRIRTPELILFNFVRIIRVIMVAYSPILQADIAKTKDRKGLSYFKWRGYVTVDSMFQACESSIVTS